MKATLYRKGVGAIILNQQGLVFVAKRITPPDAWQMPQGGIDGNETPQVALMRELKEEIDNNNIEILSRTPLLTYDLPQELQNNFWQGQYLGQQQYWFFVKFLGKDSDINLNTPLPEFNQWAWLEYQQLTKIIVPFKKDLYQSIIKLGKQYKIFN